MNNETLSNITEYGLFHGPWRTNCSFDWWSILVTSVIITLHSTNWLKSTFDGIGGIKDLVQE